MIELFKKSGQMALGSRLRMLGERLMEDAKKVYARYGVELNPKWFPVFYTLSHTEEMSITEIAQEIGHSHPSVSQIVREMKKAGVLESKKGEKDRRVNTVRLTAEGRAIIPKIKKQYHDVGKASEELIAEAPHDLWKALEDVEYLLSQRNLIERVASVRRARVAQEVEMLDYDPSYADDFKNLNYAWIEKYFVVEEEDRYALENPQEKILDPGGCIVMAKYEGKVVGTCGLIKMQEEGTYELAKMAVTESAQGLHIGWLLGLEMLKKAKELNAKKVFLESNTSLEPAINLYRKLGFKRIVGEPSPYARSNIQMEVILEDL